MCTYIHVDENKPKLVADRRMRRGKKTVITTNTRSYRGKVSRQAFFSRRCCRGANRDDDDDGKKKKIGYNKSGDQQRTVESHHVLSAYVLWYGIILETRITCSRWYEDSTIPNSRTYLVVVALDAG